MDGKPVYNDESVVDPEKRDAAGVPQRNGEGHDVNIGDGQEYYKLPFWTRMGCTAESFKRRSAVDKHNQLNQTLRSRHMHMIAIGKLLLQGHAFGHSRQI